MSLPKTLINVNFRLCQRRCSLLYARSLSDSADSTLRNAVLHIPKSNVYRFGDSNNATPVFRDLQWTMHEGESWVVIGSGSGEKTTLFQTLLGHLRISPPPPPPGGLFPFISLAPGPPRDLHTSVSLVSFGNRRRTSQGAFYDYTARYGAVREEDRVTLRQSMFPDSPDPRASEDAMGIETSQQENDLFRELIDKMGLTSLLDLPLVALSNGQTRRARIVKSVLSKPELLLLDEPLTGLDVENRPNLLSLLHSLHIARSPRVIIGLRPQDPIPEWTTHVAIVRDGMVRTGRKEEVLAAEAKPKTTQMKPVVKSMEKIAVNENSTPHKNILVDLKNVKVAYHGRKVLNDINWEIRQGERWHLQGANGSGKTTLLSLLTGDHPQSYTQLPSRGSQLTLFGRPRSRIPTPELHSLIGVVSPELFNAFPRRGGMTVWEAVATGFDGGFVPFGEDGVGVGIEGRLTDAQRHWRVGRVWEVLEGLGPDAWSGARMNPAGGKKNSLQKLLTTSFKERKFVDLSAGEQSVVLLMRALVGQPPLVLLDEVWSGMDEGMVRVAKEYLRGAGVREDQAVVVVSHWEEEVPWDSQDGVRRFRLRGGVGKVLGPGDV